MTARITFQRSIQAPSAVIMIRPRHFTPNPETAADNAFQQSPSEISKRDDVAMRAYDEVGATASALRDAGVRVDLFDCDRTDTPDAVFPNNWISTHPGGHVAVFPMFAESRRRERRQDIIEHLKEVFRVQDVIDYSGLEPDGLFLEGTGAMVLDHVDRVAYTIRSNRANQIALERFCTHFNYEPMVFDACDAHGVPVYHTNVLMCIGTGFAMIGLDMFQDTARRDEIVGRLEASGRTIIPLTNAQIECFSGNAIELQGRESRVVAISRRGYDALTDDQISRIETSARLLPVDVSTIELAGGSVRCMIIGNHLTKR